MYFIDSMPDSYLSEKVTTLEIIFYTWHINIYNIWYYSSKDNVQFSEGLKQHLKYVLEMKTQYENYVIYFLIF